MPRSCQIQRRGVRRDDRSALDDLVQLLEDQFLDLHAFEYRLDDQVGILDVVVRQRPGDPFHAPVEFVLRQPALLQRALVILLHRAEALVQRGLRRLEHCDRNAGIGKIHRDPAAHGAGADHGHRLDRTQRRGGRYIGNLGSGAHRKKRVPQCLRFRTVHQFDEQRAFDLHSLVKGLERGRLDCIDALERRRIILGERSNRVAGKIQKRLDVGKIDLDVARFF